MAKYSKILALFIIFAFAAVLAGIAQPQEEETVVCPVGCGKFKKSEAKATYEYEGTTYYFCSEKCKEAFVKNPEKYTQKKAEKKHEEKCEMKEVYVCPKCKDVKSDKPGKCPKCGMELKKKMMMKHMEAHKKTEEKACCAMMHCMSCKDVEVNIENLENGIAIKITSKDAEAVKKIQECAAKMKASCAKECAKKEEAKKEKE